MHSRHTSIKKKDTVSRFSLILFKESMGNIVQCVLSIRYLPCACLKGTDNAERRRTDTVSIWINKTIVKVLQERTKKLGCKMSNLPSELFSSLQEV